MTEGPQAHLIADRIRTALAGRRLQRLQWKDGPGWPAESYRGRRVVDVQCHGKELFVHLDADETFRIHLLMGGRVMISEPHEETPAPVRLLFETDLQRVAVVGTPSIKRMTRAEAKERTASLGPDATARDFDAARFRRNLHAQGARTIAESLLDQAVVAGVGNMSKSEILLRAGIDPRTRADRLGLRERGALARLTHEFLRGAYESKKRGQRTRLLVYHRGGRPCPQCGTPIESARIGGRSTYWCPSCQPPQRTV